MITYFVTIFFVMLFSGIAKQQDIRSGITLQTVSVEHSKTARAFFFAASFVLVFVAGFRFYVGTDYSGYYWFGDEYAADLWHSLKTLTEPGINVLYRLIRIFTKNKGVPIFIFAFITIGKSMQIIWKNTDSLFLATVLFVFLGCWHGSFNAVKQCLAVTIVFSGLYFMKTQQFWKYALVVFIAFLFHKSAVVMLFPYFVVHKPVTKRHVIVLVLLSVVVLLSYDLVMGLTESLLETTFTESNAYIWRRVNRLRVAVAVTPAIYFLWAYSKREKSDYQTFYINICIIHAVLMLMASNSTYLARISMYSAPFMAIAIPELLKGLPSKSQKTLKILIVVLYGVFFFYEVSNSDSLNHFYWTFAH